ncbi:hypothetical protein A2348_03695 [Candidatus Uhrbacteria bacterium RIFOXYB12_FULL_58_10]|nr:MAG: hypothetical protein A2348_03695 [Candidatus Uhrbacteria bacterium RIFOXYB12_FULL_58_10]
MEFNLSERRRTSVSDRTPLEDGAAANRGRPFIAGGVFAGHFEGRVILLATPAHPSRGKTMFSGDGDVGPPLRLHRADSTIAAHRETTADSKEEREDDQISHSYSWAADDEAAMKCLHLN